MFNASKLLTGLKVLPLLGAMALSTPTAALAQTNANDQNFLNDMYSFLHGQDDLAHELANWMGDEMNVYVAQSLCQEFASGRSAQSLYAEFNAGVISTMDAATYEQVDYATGLYIGSIMNLGSAYYCPEYQPQVVQALQSL